jgi:hypothetical protein
VSRLWRALRTIYVQLVVYCANSEPNFSRLGEEIEAEAVPEDKHKRDSWLGGFFSLTDIGIFMMLYFSIALLLVFAYIHFKVASKRRFTDPISFIRRLVTSSSRSNS